MIKILLFTLFAFSLYAQHYPKPYKTMASPLFQARVSLDPLVYEDIFRQQVLEYQAESDKILGKYRLIKVSSNPTTLTRYRTALNTLQKRHHALLQSINKHLSLIIDLNNYPLFLSIFNSNYEFDLGNPYLREKVYTYYHAHRNEGSSLSLDKDILSEWDNIVYYSSNKPRTNYSRTENARYREVILINSEFSPYGKKVKTFFKKNHVKYKAYDIDKDDKGKEIFKKYHGNRIPLVIINGHSVEGYNALEMDKLLRH